MRAAILFVAILTVCLALWQWANLAPGLHGQSTYTNTAFAPLISSGRILTNLSSGYSQGVQFVTSDVIAVFQVSENLAPPVQNRNAAGGSGRFTLRAAFIRASNGQLLHRMEWDADRGRAGIFPTRDGRFIVRTGLLLRLYSAEYQQIASTTLERPAPDSLDYWGDILVSPQGTQAYSEFYENVRRGSKLPFKVIRVLLNADDLSLIRKWSSEEKPWGSPWRDNPPVGSDARKQTLLSPSDTILLSLSGRETFASARTTGNMIAAEVERRPFDPFDLGKRSKPLRLEIVGVNGNTTRCSIKIDSGLHIFRQPSLYALLKDELLVAIQVTNLSSYFLKNIPGQTSTSAK